MRKANPRIWIETDIVERLNDAAIALVFGHARMMDLEAFLDDLGDRHARRERAVGILENDLHVAAERTHFLETAPLQIVTHESDQSFGRDQPQDRASERRLARAGFADHAERLALAQLDAQAVAGFDVADDLAQQPARDRKPDLQVLGLDHDRRIGLRRRRIGLRLGGKQRAGIGMLRRGEDLRDRALLDDLAVLHHADPLRDLAHDAEIVGDEQQRHVRAGLQVLQQRDDLRLHRDVERGGRLVGDEQIGLVGERHGDHHALPLAAGQLMWIAFEPRLRIGNADLGEHLDRPLARRRRRSVRDATARSRRSAFRSCAAD